MFERFKAMDQQTKISLILAGIIGILLFGTVTSGIRQAGWNEGFLAGLLTNPSGNTGETARAVAPYAGAHGVYAHHGWGGHGVGFIGGFFRFLFFGFLLMMFFKFLGFWRWRMHGGHRWHHHPHGPWHHHQHGPWGQPQGQPSAEQGRPSDPSPAQPEGHTPQPTSWVKV
jgi:hypothetical protein